MQLTTISKFAAFSKITNKACYFMRIVCHHENRLLADDSHVISYLIFVENWEMSQNLSSAAVVIGALRVKVDFLGMSVVSLDYSVS